MKLPVEIRKQTNALTHNGVYWRPRSRFPKSLRPRYARDAITRMRKPKAARRLMKTSQAHKTLRH